MTPKTNVISATRMAVVVLGIAAAPVPAWSWVTYEASLGTLPQAQGWTLVEDISPPMPYTVGVGAGQLHLSTLGFASDGTNGGGVWWQRNDMPIDFSGDFSVEVSVRIASAPNHSVNAVAGYPRPGYTLAAYDVNGRFLWIGLGSGEIFLSNTAFGQYGTANTVTTPFNTTDAIHVYRLERGAGGVGAALRIDGVTRLTLPALGPVEAGAGLVYFGDPTYWANSESFTSSVRYSSETVDVEPSSRSGPLSATVVGSPAARPCVAFLSGESGTLAFEIFDTAGRRVAGTERNVVASESGTFVVADGLRNGVYFYRLRLVSRSGRTSEVSGRIVLVH